MDEPTYTIDDDGVLIVAGRSFPWVETEKEDVDLTRFEMPMQHIRRAVVWFENGWGLSFIWGDGTYSTNGNRMLDDSIEFTEHPTQAELAFICRHHGIVGGDVVPMVPADVALQIIERIQTLASCPGGNDCSLSIVAMPVLGFGGGGESN